MLICLPLLFFLDGCLLITHINGYCHTCVGKPQGHSLRFSQKAQLLKGGSAIAGLYEDSCTKRKGKSPLVKPISPAGDHGGKSVLYSSYLDALLSPGTRLRRVWKAEATVQSSH